MQDEVRPVRAADLLAISRMAFANMTGVDPQFTRLVSRPIRRWLSHLTLPFYFGLAGRGFKVVRAGRIIGCAYLYLRPNSGYVFNVSVNRPYRRQGVARGLMAHLEGLIQARGRGWAALQVDWDNSPARALYAGIGYRAYHPGLFRL
ncbi:MAG: GNAT family N-acetyltransferase, partial [Candidatus Promineifilaceae bacterium]